MGNATLTGQWGQPVAPKAPTRAEQDWLDQARLDRISKPTGIRFREQTKWTAAYRSKPPTELTQTALERLIESQKRRTSDPPPIWTRAEWENAMDTLESLEGQHAAMRAHFPSMKGNE